MTIGKHVVRKLHAAFEDKVHDISGVEYWYARDLQKLLGYGKWENFYKTVIPKGKLACENAGSSPEQHFIEVSHKVEMPKGGSKEVADLMLTRYACYLIAQNSDPRKEEVAFAMRYFAEQTRKMELVEKRIAEYERVEAHKKLRFSEQELDQLISERGFDDKVIERIKEDGHIALFGGHSTAEMKEKLDVPFERDLSDFLPTISIKAKDFANEISTFNIKKDGIGDEGKISREHVNNNAEIRKLLLQKGIKPEELPAEIDVKELESKLLKEVEKLNKSNRNSG